MSDSESEVEDDTDRWDFIGMEASELRHIQELISRHGGEIGEQTNINDKADICFQIQYRTNPETRTLINHNLQNGGGDKFIYD
jgi:hypothetical protein